MIEQGVWDTLYCGYAARVTWFALAGEATESVDADAVSATVVGQRLRALVEVADLGDGVEQPCHVQVSVAFKQR